MMNTETFHTKTPAIAVLDNRGLIVRNIAYCRHPDTPDVTSERITRHQYDVRGFLTQNADPRLHDAGLANFVYHNDLTGNTLSTQSADAGTVISLNDAAGRPFLTVNAAGITCTFQYEGTELSGRPLSITEQAPDGTARITERFVYAGNTAAEKALNLAGQCVSHYDTAGLVQTDSIALTGVPLSVTRRLLKDADNPDTVADWQGDDASAWNDLSDSEAYAALTTADATGAVLTTTDAKGNQQRVTYDVAGLLSGSWLTLKGGKEQTIVASLTYSAAGQKLREEHGNGVVTTYSYEPETQRLVGIKTERPAGHKSGQKVLQDLRYEYDPVGNVLNLTNDAEETRFWRNQKVVPENAYVYDSLYQLVSATGREMAGAGQQGSNLPSTTVPLPTDSSAYTSYTRNYSYDEAGNLTQIRHSAPATNNSYTTSITISNRSNRAVLSSLTENATDVDALFTAGGQQKQLQPGQGLAWTSRGELLKVTPVVREGSANDGESYRYDGGSQRILKVCVQKTNTSTQTQRVLYLAGLELRTIKSGDTETESQQVITVGEAGRAQVRVLHWEAGKPDDIGNDQLRYSYDNLLGSSGLEVDGEGNLISLEEYYPYGGTAVWMARSKVEADYKVLRYSGKERDATGLYYYGWRYYQPWACRWLSADPAGTIDGLNLYRMVRNNPQTLLDDNGKAPSSPNQIIDANFARLPDYFSATEKPAIEMSQDRRALGAVKEDISRGSYKMEEMRELFQSEQGLAGTLKGSRLFPETVLQSGWQNNEAVVKNELRIISQFQPVKPDITLYRGLSMSPEEFNKLNETGFIQNYGLSFFSSNREVAKYFARKDVKAGNLKVLFELKLEASSQEKLHFYKGRIDIDAYRGIIQDRQSRFNQKGLEGLQEVIALPGNVFKVRQEQREPQEGILNTLRKTFRKKDITTVPLTLYGYQTRQISHRHSNYM